MNTKQLLALSLISFAIASNIVAMEPKKEETAKQRAAREAKEAAQRRIEEQRKEKAEREGIAPSPSPAQNQPVDLKEIMKRKFEEQQALERQQLLLKPAAPEVSQPNDNNAMPAMEEEVIFAPVMEPEDIIVPAKDKEEDTGPSDEELARDLARADELRQQTLEETNASILRFNEIILRKQNEGFLAREIADTLISKASEARLRDLLERYATAREFIGTRYAGDAEFTPIIDSLNARSAQLELELQLLDKPHDKQLWDQLNALFEQLIIDNIENAQFAQTLTSQHAAYQEARQMILAGHQPSGIAIIDSFEEIDRTANDQLLAQQVNEQLLGQARAEQIAQGEAAARRLQAQERAEQDRAGLEAARRLEQALNPHRRQPQPQIAPAPVQNQPNNNPVPGNPNVVPNEPKFDLMTFMQKPEFMQGVIAAAGLTAVSFVIYKIYNWFTQKAKTPSHKKQEALRKKQPTARSKRPQARTTRYAKPSKR